MDYNRRNPMGRAPRGDRGTKLDPFEFQDQLENSIFVELDKFQRDVYKWLGKYGIGIRGYTVISKRDYQKKLKAQFGNKLEQKVPEKFFKCDGAILISETEHANLTRIILGDGWQSNSLERIANLYWANFDFPETELGARMKVVLELLRHEFDDIAHKRGFYTSREASPFIFKPDDKYRYKAVNYRVIPIYSYIKGKSLRNWGSDATA